MGSKFARCNWKKSYDLVDLVIDWNLRHRFRGGIPIQYGDRSDHAGAVFVARGCMAVVYFDWPASRRANDDGLRLR